MGKILTADEIARYKSDGLICPKRLISADEAARYLAALEAYETATGGPVNGKWRYKSHLVFPWINEMMRLPQILDAVEDLLEPSLSKGARRWPVHLLASRLRALGTRQQPNRHRVGGADGGI